MMLVTAGASAGVSGVCRLSRRCMGPSNSVSVSAHFGTGYHWELTPLSEKKTLLTVAPSGRATVSSF